MSSELWISSSVPDAEADTEIGTVSSTPASGEVLGAEAPFLETEDQLRKVAMDAAVRMLALREHAAEELRQKLIRKGHAEQTAHWVIEELQRLDLQSDLRFVDSFFRGRLSKGHGPLRIRHDLSQKGIAESLVEEVLTQHAEFWLDLAEQVRAKRFGQDLPSGDTVAWTAQARFLAHRGFPSDLIYRVLGSRY
jgi:regulatory protein